MSKIQLQDSYHDLTITSSINSQIIFQEKIDKVIEMLSEINKKLDELETHSYIKDKRGTPANTANAFSLLIIFYLKSSQLTSDSVEDFIAWAKEKCPGLARDCGLL